MPSSIVLYVWVPVSDRVHRTRCIELEGAFRTAVHKLVPQCHRCHLSRASNAAVFARSRFSSRSVWLAMIPEFITLYFSYSLWSQLKHTSILYTILWQIGFTPINGDLSSSYFSGELDITVDLLNEMDKFIQLLESPIFACTCSKISILKYRTKVYST